MKLVQLKTTAIVFAATTLAMGTAHAGIYARSSDTAKVVAGSSTINGGPHVSGRPGLSVPATGLSNLVDFQGLQASVGTDGNGVSNINSGTSVPTDHSNLGVFHFTKIGTANLYVGEWNQTSSVSAGDHTVYYAGDDGGTTTVPATGTATYAVRGISDYANKGLLTGTFTADFANATLTGSIANSTSGYAVNIGTADIDGVNIAGSDASATQSNVSVATGGEVNGRFFGANAAALAGTVEFANRQYDTAFGGTKN